MSGAVGVAIPRKRRIIAAPPAPTAAIVPVAASEVVDTTTKGDIVQMKIISRKDEILIFEISGITVNVANCLRRAVMEYVESVAFKGSPATDSDIHITSNSSAVVNEEVLERVSLIPIFVSQPWKFDPAKYEFRINIAHSDRENGLDVTSGDFEVRETGGADTAWHTANEFFHPDRITKDHILITRLPPAPLIGNTVVPQQFALTATASVGCGINHASYIPALITYEYTGEDESTPAGRDRLQAAFDKWIRDSKKERSLETPEGTRVAKAEYDSMERHRVYKQNSRGEPASFLFTVESVGPVGPAAIVARAIELLADRLAIYTKIAETLPESASSVPCVTGMVGIDLVLRNETHTIGSLLQFHLVRDAVDLNKDVTAETMSKERPLLFAGYNVPHPLEAAILLRLGTISDANVQQDALRAVGDCAIRLQKDMLSMRDMWVDTVAKARVDTA